MNPIFAMACLSVLALVNQVAVAAAPETVDCSTLKGKVMCGYQGWFNCQGDGTDLGWKHWERTRSKPFGPGNVSVDLWPDVTELDPQERFATGFRHHDGAVAEVFSSANRRTVIRHFQWMADYGIDGVFVQRFANGLQNKGIRENRNSVLANARAGAEKYGRAFAVMYDLSGMNAGSINRVLEDWRSLESKQSNTKSDRYLHHNGKPLVAVWGVGFNDRHTARDYSLAECRKLIEGLKDAGCSIMLGVPTGWREQNRDSVEDTELHGILSLADVLSPWTVGRYRNPQEAARHGRDLVAPDIAWCRPKKIDYLPVVFPGFSWTNLKSGVSPLGQIPRLKGEFLWSQIVSAKRSGAEMIYVAMFDEVDEATAIFKCTDNPPVGEGVNFLTYEGLPSDHYLRIVGYASKVLRDEEPVTDKLPLSRLDAPSQTR